MCWADTGTAVLFLGGTTFIPQSHSALLLRMSWLDSSILYTSLVLSVFQCAVRAACFTAQRFPSPLHVPQYYPLYWASWPDHLSNVMKVILNSLVCSWILGVYFQCPFILSVSTHTKFSNWKKVQPYFSLNLSEYYVNKIISDLLHGFYNVMAFNPLRHPFVWLAVRGS